MSKAHNKSILPLHGVTLPVDSSAVDLFHYDVSPNGINGTKPVDYLYDDSLVCWLEMQEQNNSKTYIVDKSRYGNHGRITGTTLVNGINGKAISFNGTSSDFVTVNNPLKGASVFTIAFWMKHDSPAVESNVFAFSTTSSTTAARIEYTGSNYTWYINGCFPTGAVLFTHDGTAYDHIVLTCDGTNVYAYKNGTQTYTAAKNSANLPTCDQIHLGCRIDNGYWKGYLHEFRIYTRALSATEVTALYNLSIYSQRMDGKYGGSIAIEEETTNLIPTIADSGWWLSKSNYQGTSTITTGSNPLLTTSARFDFKPRSDPGSGGYQVAEYKPILKAYDTALQYTMSIWIRLLRTDVGGIYITMRDGDGSDQIMPQLTYIPTDTLWHRWEYTFTPLVTGHDPYIYISAAQQAGYDSLSFELADPQIEQKAFATSFTSGYRASGRLVYDGSTFPKDEFTVSFWVKRSTQDVSVCALSVNSGDTNRFGFILRDVGDVLLSYYDGSLLHAQNSFGTIDPTGWNFVACTYRKTDNTMAVYLNGTKAQSTVVIPDHDQFQYIMIGTDFDGVSAPLNGMIDELRIDKVARTQEEIMAWYLSGCPFYPRGNERACL